MTREKFILALDQGTTSSRAIVFNKLGEVVASAQKELTQHYPQPGWVEHDPQEIYQTQVEVMGNAVSLAGGHIDAIGITNQRETIIVWEKKTGKPIYNAIVWQDNRTADYCNSLGGKASMIQSKTGLVIDAYFSASKIKWILDHVPCARDMADRGELLAGTVDSWLVWKLTNGDIHITDVSNASRTQLFNINTLEWDRELLELFDIPFSMLPTVTSSSEKFGAIIIEGFDYPLQLAAIIGDQQSALFGQLCIQPGMVKTTYGTGCFMLMQIGENAVFSNNKLLTTIAWKIGGKVFYALEGSIFVGGAVVQWLRDGLEIIKESNEVEVLSQCVTDNNEVYFVPAFVGLGAPHWDGKARGSMFGLTRGTTKAHIARASLEAISYQVMDVMSAMEEDAKMQISEMRVDGGVCTNDSVMQFQSDVSNIKILRPDNLESTAIGAAFLAGLATGYWKDIDELKAITNKINRSFRRKTRAK